jgi:hypothetical protein
MILPCAMRSNIFFKSLVDEFRQQRDRHRPLRGVDQPANEECTVSHLGFYAERLTPREDTHRSKFIMARSERLGRG